VDLARGSSSATFGHRDRRRGRRLERVEDAALQGDVGWDPEAMPADWEAGRRRYFTINWIQMATTWAAFALFLVALVSL
jgi:hypothetical protein